MGFLTGDDAPVIWRGPMLHGVVQQFFARFAGIASITSSSTCHREPVTSR